MEREGEKCKIQAVRPPRDKIELNFIPLLLYFVSYLIIINLHFNCTELELIKIIKKENPASCSGLSSF
jgi:hypothetical protein